MIDEVISRFDFPRVQTAMQSHGWWYGGESEALFTEIPGMVVSRRLDPIDVRGSRARPQGGGHPVAGIARVAVK